MLIHSNLCICASWHTNHRGFCMIFTHLSIDPSRMQHNLKGCLESHQTLLLQARSATAPMSVGIGCNTSITVATGAQAMGGVSNDRKATASSATSFSSPERVLTRQVSQSEAQADSTGRSSADTGPVISSYSGRAAWAPSTTQPPGVDCLPFESSLSSVIDFIIVQYAVYMSIA